MTRAIPLRSWACAALLLAGPAAAQAQVADSLLKAKALYAEASYDDALRVLGGSDAIEAHQYRALCFLALGKTADAEKALEQLITMAPSYAVSETDLPPRVVALFTQTRRRVLPGLIRQMFSAARNDFQAKELERSRGKFEQVLTLSSDPALKDVAELQDIKVLSSSYLDIVKSSAPAPLTPTTSRVVADATVSAAPVVTAAPAPVPVPATTGTSAGNPPAAPGAPAARPSLAAVAAGGGSTVRPPSRQADVVPAVTIKQTMPPYTPTPGMPARELKGSVRVVIGADGKVTSVAIEKSVEPRYDLRLLIAAKAWLYKPATLDGQPVESEKLVVVTVGVAP